MIHVVTVQVTAHLSFIRASDFKNTCGGFCLVGLFLTDKTICLWEKRSKWSTGLTADNSTKSVISCLCHGRKTLESSVLFLPFVSSVLVLVNVLFNTIAVSLRIMMNLVFYNNVSFPKRCFLPF